MRHLLLSAALLCFGGSTVSAAVLSIDFNRDDTATTLTSNGTATTVGNGQSNTVSPTQSTFQPFNLSGTSLDGVHTRTYGDFTVSLRTLVNSGRDRGSPSADNPPNFTRSALYRDLVQNIARTAAPVSNPAPTAANNYYAGLAVSGLAANTEYSFQFFAYDSGNTNQVESIFDYTGSTAAGPGTLLGTITRPSPNVAPTTNNDYSLAVNVTTDANGRALFNFTADNPSTLAVNDGNPVLNGFIVSVVPEPASLALLGLGGLMVLGRTNKA